MELCDKRIKFPVQLAGTLIADRSVVNRQQSEIDYYLWVSPDEALKMCRHENDVKILKEVRKLI